MLDYFLSQPVFGKFCELQSLVFPAEFWNTYSNFAYILLAILLFYKFGKRAIAYSILLSIVGISSVLYHGFWIRGFQLFDIGAIYLIVAYVIFFLYKYPERKNLLFSVSIATFTIVLNIFFPILGRTFIIAYALIATYLLVRRFKKRSFLPIIILAIAYIGWIFDASFLCFENMPYFNGHVIWHILTAIALALVGRLILSDNAE